MQEMTAIPRLPPRSAESHKGSFGRVLLVAGQRGMSGAAVLAGMAALKAGAGLVTVACPEIIQDSVATAFPCYTTLGLPCDDRGQLAMTAFAVVDHASQASQCLAIGPGLGISGGAALLVYRIWKASSQPIIVDADALNVLNMEPRTAASILTPHPGEFARLTKSIAPKSHEERLERASTLAREYGVIVLLKGHRTIVTDGTQYFVNTTGNPGMATAGSGDVLTGILAALIAQGLSAFEAAVLGAHVHGRAGDFAAEVVGQISLTALDIISHLPNAFAS